MNSLLFNFARRSILIPLVVTLLALAASFVAMPRLVASSNNETPVVANRVDVADYKLTDFDSFKSLEKETYIGNISIENLNINSAVVYGSGDELDALIMKKGSTEPWSTGSMVVTGTNTKSQFNYLHSAQIGDGVNLEVYKHSTYRYKISGIKYGVEENDLKSYFKNNTLVLCLPYTNFYSVDQDNLYTVYTADLVNGGDTVD